MDDVIVGYPPPTPTAFGVQNANKGLFGPATGADATPTFRSLVAADIPTLTPAIFSVQNANKVLAGPANGADTTPTFRSLVAADIPSLPASQITSGTLSTARLGTGTPDSMKILDGSGAWRILVAADIPVQLNPFGVGGARPTGVTLAVPVAPTATANYGSLSLGSGPFDGSTSGFFAGNSNGTHIAVNAASGYLGRMLDLQIAGVRVAGIGRTTVASATSGTLNAVDFSANTVTITGNTAITTAGGFNYLTVGQPTYTAASAVAITNGATVMIAAAPTVAGSATLTNAYALWVAAGSSRFDGVVRGTVNGALSSSTGPAAQFNGTWVTGGDATTTKPYFLIEPTGTTSTGWGTSGTGFGVNAASGFVGLLADFQLNGASKLNIDRFGQLVLAGGGIIQTAGQWDLGYQTAALGMQSAFTLSWSSTTSAQGTKDLLLRRGAAASLVQGAANSATPVAQTFTIGESSRAGTDTNIAGASGTIRSGLGTGTGAVATLIFQTPTAAVSGTGAQTYTNRLTLGSTATFTTQVITNASSGCFAVSTDTAGFFSIGAATDVIISRNTAHSIQMGYIPSATPFAYVMTIGESSRSGTDTNTAGANGTIRAGLGTGTAIGTQLILQSALPTTTGTGAQSYVTGALVQYGALQLTNYIVSALPSASAAGVGATAFVTDASTTVILGLGLTVAGNGSNKVPVYSDGTNWIIG